MFTPIGSNQVRVIREFNDPIRVVRLQPSNQYRSRINRFMCRTLSTLKRVLGAGLLVGESIFDGIASRVAQDRDEGDVSYFHALALRMEFDVKLATVGLIACIEDDADRNRYGLEHTLVRANSLGNWTSALHSSLLGPPAQFFGPRVRSIVQEFTVNHNRGTLAKRVCLEHGSSRHDTGYTSFDRR